MSPRTGINSYLRACPRQRKSNYSIICNKTPATVSGEVQPCQLLPVLLSLTQGCREELLLPVVNTKYLGHHLPSPANGRFVLYHSGKYYVMKTEKSG